MTFGDRKILMLHRSLRHIPSMNSIYTILSLFRPTVNRLYPGLYLRFKSLILQVRFLFCYNQQIRSFNLWTILSTPRSGRIFSLVMPRAKCALQNIDSSNRKHLSGLNKDSAVQIGYIEYIDSKLGKNSDCQHEIVWNSCPEARVRGFG